MRPIGTGRAITFGQHYLYPYGLRAKLEFCRRILIVPAMAPGLPEGKVITGPAVKPLRASDDVNTIEKLFTEDY